MKTSTAYSKYFKQIAKSINSLLKKPVPEYDKEDYHRLRVEIKKLNAFLDALLFCDENFNRDKYFKAFKKIFKQAGKIRESQLEETILKKYEQYAIGHYLSDLKNSINKGQRKFIKIIDKDFRKKIKKSLSKIEPFIDKMNEQKVKEFQEKERSKITDLIQQKNLKPKKVHQLRKLLKVDYYNRKHLDVPGQNINIIREEDEFLVLLGKWHDCRIMNNELEKSITKEAIDPTELNQLLQIDAEVLANSENLMKDINASIETKSLSFLAKKE
jgi:CHAD domain-containing protein